MQKRFVAIAALVAALTAMAFAVSSAGAVTMSVSPGGTTTAASSSLTFEGSGISIVCPLTLTMEFLRGPITIATGSQIGEVTGVTIGRCSGGNLSAALNLNWRITIDSTLPAIERLTTRNATGLLVDITGFAWNFSVILGGLVNCLYSGTAGVLLPLTHTARESVTYTASTIDALRTTSIPLSRGSFGCPATETLAARFTLGATQTVTLS